MKRLIFSIVILLSYTTYARQCPPNLDFESGDFSNWQCFEGYVTAHGGINNAVMTPTAPLPGRHEIISASSTPAMDPYGNFPTLCPYGGNYSVKLGNDLSGSGAEGISYTFQVPAQADTFTFTYYYAVVFENPWHAPIEQPRFFVTAYDVLTGNPINCASYDFVANGNIPGFKGSAMKPGVLYKEWSPVSIQFTGLANRDVRLEFKTSDCANGGHFGYAYIDVGSNCNNILATAPYCIETNSVVLNAPYGYQSYTWYNEDYSVVLGNQQSVTISPPPPLNVVYHVDMTPYPGYGCRDTVETIAVPLPAPDTPAATPDHFYCQLTAAAPLTAVARADHYLLWYNTATGGTGSTTAPVPSTSTAGNFDYYVSQKEFFGCESLRKKITVAIGLTPVTSFTVNNNRQCQENNQFVFTNTSSNLANSIFDWDFGDGHTQSSGQPDATHAFTGYGRFDVTLKVFNPPGCAAESKQVVTVIPKPVASFSYPPVICEKQTMVTLTDNSYVPDGLSPVKSRSWNINSSPEFVQILTPFIAGSGGPMPVKLVVATPEGCRSDTNTTFIPVHYRPVAAFNYTSHLCNNEPLQFNNLSYMPAGAGTDFIAKWQWQFDNAGSYVMQHPVQGFTAGMHRAALTAETNSGCRSLVADSLFEVYAKPEISLSISDSCVFRSIQYQGVDPQHTVDRWYWNFGNGFKQVSSPVTKTYQRAGDYLFSLIGQTLHGCRDTITRRITIFDNKAWAGSDTTAAMNQPVQLHARGGQNVQYTWSPAIGLDDATLENPVAILDRDQLYQLYAVTDKGCTSQSKIFIKRYKGPDLYLPNAFTPNGDGKNDAYRVIAVGVKQFGSLTIYNRYGQRIFHSTDHTQGWDGTLNGRQQEPGNYVAIVQAVDYSGAKIVRKGNVVLIR